MIHEKWVISDHHFFHSNILRFRDGNGERLRPFNTISEMHETMVRKHNSVVGKDDYVYFGGDVTFQYNKQFVDLMFSLNGKKRLIIGNHDKIWNEHLMRCFEKAALWKGFSEHNFTISHMPLPLDSLRDGAYNVHGHTHANIKSDPHYINICVETRDYKPVNFDQIIKEIKAVEEDLKNRDKINKKLSAGYSGTTKD